MPNAKKVLVCDDELYILESVTYVVRQEGYTVLSASDGEEALRLARAELPALMLLDIMMPKRNGFEVCGELKSDPLTQGIYVILLTAMGQERDMDEGYQSGADEYMTKHFSPRSLRKRLHELLD
ncbi:MAG: response regulator [Acidobacteria bacterium]|nr:response regulator [Acidobacteriota bacterium]